MQNSGQKLESWAKFWTKLMVLDRWKKWHFRQDTSRVPKHAGCTIQN